MMGQIKANIWRHRYICTSCTASIYPISALIATHHFVAIVLVDICPGGK